MLESNCAYDGTPPEGWEKGLVGFRPAPVFDSSQTAGEPLPELETAATGDGAELVAMLLEAAPSTKRRRPNERRLERGVRHLD